MKKYSYLCLCTMCVVFSFVSCNKKEDSYQDVDLYSVMELYSQHYNSVIEFPLNDQTKSGDAAFDCLSNNCPDISVLDEKYVSYLDFYTRSNSISDWDEREVLELISKDSSFTPDERIYFAQSLSFAYYVKNTSEPSIQITKSANDCYAAYSKASRRALRRAVATLLVGLIEPTLAGETLAVAMYAIEMSEAEEDYYECLHRQ